MWTFLDDDGVVTMVVYAAVSVEITVKTVREKLENKGCRDPCRPMSKGGPLVVQRTGESVPVTLYCRLLSIAYCLILALTTK